MDRTLQAVLAAAASFFLAIIIISFIIIICKSTKKPTQPIRRTRKRTRTVSVPEHELSSISIGESQSFDPSVNLISMEELKIGTKNFSPDLIIGDGSFGLVYKATLSCGLIVAIKKLDPDAFQGFREFRAEMETLGKLRHPNIVKILGYCISGRDRVLIYEFLERGSLYQWLHDTSSEESAVPLSWETRIRIVKGIANGLAYLHGLHNPIIHRDIKAGNVLLDMGFEAHIADFGLARLVDGSHSHVSTQVAGTMGYMPPEYKDGATVATVKADVYSFGILMIEIATGNRPNWPMVLDGKEVGLVYWARKMVEEGREMEMVDSTVPRDELDEVKVKEYFRIACMCASDMFKDRPIMRDVVDLLTDQIGTSKTYSTNLEK